VNNIQDKTRFFTRKKCHLLYFCQCGWTIWLQLLLHYLQKCCTSI